MPHIAKYLIDGQPAPSVNEVTGCLSKDSLINFFWRPLGFVEADKITGESRDRGIATATALENYRKGLVQDIPPEIAPFVALWDSYQCRTGYTIQVSEPHLESRKYLYHGSPDGLGHLPGQPIELFDDKVKDKRADYKILMNEAAYAQAWLEMHGEKISQFRIFTYHPVKLAFFEDVYENKPEYLDDFLRCREMLEVNKRADAWYRTHCRKIK